MKNTSSELTEGVIQYCSKQNLISNILKINWNTPLVKFIIRSTEINFPEKQRPFQLNI